MVEKKGRYSDKERDRLEQKLMRDSQRELTNSLIFDYFRCLTQFEDFNKKFKSIAGNFITENHDQIIEVQSSYTLDNEHFTFRYGLQDNDHRYLDITKDIILTDDFSLKNEHLLLSTLENKDNEQDNGYLIKYLNIPQSKSEILIGAENSDFAIICAQDLLSRIEIISERQ